MNDEKNAIEKKEWNPRLEPSSAITDSELNEVVGGEFKSMFHVDENKKIIYVIPVDVGFDLEDISKKETNLIFKQKIDQGYNILYSSFAKWGPQLK